MKYLQHIAVMVLFVHYVSLAQSNVSYKNTVDDPVLWKVEKSSTLLVSGSSNINSFICAMDYSNSSDTLSMDMSLSGGRIPFVDKDMVLNVFNFDCNNSLITSDFRKTLKAELYPDLILRFLTLDFQKFLKNESEILGDIEIFIAGTTNRYKIPYTISYINDQVLQLKGSKLIDLEDFCLSTPSKLLGLIKVNNEIEVDFDLKLRRVHEQKN